MRGCSAVPLTKGVLRVCGAVPPPLELMRYREVIVTCELDHSPHVLVAHLVRVRVRVRVRGRGRVMTTRRTFLLPA